MNRPGGGSNQRPDKGKGGGPGGKKYSRKRKVCHFCSDRVDYIDYKDEKLLRSYIPERGKILPRRISGVCAVHQRKLMEAVKRARNIAILPYTTL
jgi:small subunit ribosomal protein S18